MSAIAAVSRTVKTMADGTLRLTVDIEPMYANDAFALFGAGNVPMALAALVTGTAIPDKELETELRGGALARLAGMMINNPSFHDYLHETYGPSEKLGRDSADDAIKTLCQIDSKKELDHSDAAGGRFHELVRKPFVAWQDGRK